MQSSHVGMKTDCIFFFLKLFSDSSVIKYVDCSVAVRSSRQVSLEPSYWICGTFGLSDLKHKDSVSPRCPP